MSPYDHPDYHALIRTIREIDRHPTDNDSTLARLVTADWLEEHGEADRAALVRVQCGEPVTGDPIARIFGGDSYRLRWVTCGVGHMWDWTWSGGVSTRTDDPVTVRMRSGETMDYTRGFVDSVRCPLAWWITHGPEIVRRHPVEDINITDANGFVGLRWPDGRTVSYGVVSYRHPGEPLNAHDPNAELSPAEFSGIAMHWAESVADHPQECQ